MQDVVSLVCEHDDDSVKEAEQGEWPEIWEKGGEEEVLREKEPHGVASKNTGE